MSPVTRPTGVKQPEMADESAIKSWLDALASGACDESAFLLAVQEKLKSDPDGNWEALSQLDQYYRRGKIKTEVFHTVKIALAESALRSRNIAPAREALATRDIPVARDIAIPQALTTRDIPVARDIAVPQELETRDIPVARDIAVPQAPLRPELSDAPPYREEAQAQDASGELKSGSVLRRRYRIESVLGQGATGTLFQALDEYRLESPPAGQRLAIKVLHTAVAKRSELLTELHREFQDLQFLSHPNIVRVFEFDRDGGIAFFTMELLHGALLTRVLQVRKLMPLARAHALAVIRDVGAAIAYAHTRGVLHGDINPQNIFITAPGGVRVLGFGASHKSSRNSTTLHHELTLPYTTSSYASCQVLEGQRPDTRDDIFALAGIAYLLLSGQHPFSKKTAIEAREARLKLRRPPNLTNRQWMALRAGLRWERDARPADVQEWLQRLDLRGASKHLGPISELLEPPTRKESKSAFKTAMIAGVAFLFAAGYWVISDHGVLPRLDPSAQVRSSTPSPTAAPANAAPPSSTHDEISAPIARPPPPVPASRSTPATTGTTSPVATRPDAAPPAAAQSAAASPKVASRAAAPAAIASSASASAGPSKIEMAADTVDVPAAESLALVTVQRKGSLRGETSFTWWTESGTAKPGTDFLPVVPQQVTLGDGKSSVNLNVPLSKAPHAQSKSFYVVIDQSDTGAPLGARTLTMVTLLPPD
jgi:serine/threonine protein kinase